MGVKLYDNSNFTLFQESCLPLASPHRHKTLIFDALSAAWETHSLQVSIIIDNAEFHPTYMRFLLPNKKFSSVFCSSEQTIEVFSERSSLS